MLRGFRWQLLVFVMAFGLFIVALASRSDVPPEQPPVDGIGTAIPVELLAPATSTPEIPTPNTEIVSPDAEQSIPTYREALIGSVSRLNPLFANLNPVDRDITSLIFEGLTGTNGYGESVPLLAKSWIISPNGLEYVVQLRNDVLWQDGIPFTAADVVYTISLVQSADFPGDPQLATFWRTVELQQLNEHLVRFRLTQPLGSFLDRLRIGLLPEHALRGTTAAQIANHPFNLTPIGTGAYQLEALRAADGTQIQVVDLRVAPVYRARPEGQTGFGINRMRFQMFPTFEDALTAFKDGQVDALAARNRTERIALVGIGAKIHTALEPSLGILIFNWAKDSTRFFREQRVRVALQIGLDRTSLIDRYLPNQVARADSPLMPGSWAYLADLPWPAPDASVARALLENVNVPTVNAEATEEAPVDAVSGGLFSFSILVPDEPALVSIAQEIAAQWTQLNITVTVEVADAASYQSRLDTSEFDAALVELSLGDSADPDVYQFWHQGQYPDGKNYGGVDDRLIAEDLERARRDPSGINRIIHYHNFQQEFVERAIAIPLYYPLYTYATAPQVTGVQLGYIGSPTSRFYTVQNWTIPVVG